VKTSRNHAAPTFALKNVKDFRVFGSYAVKDVKQAQVDQMEI
jgi:hypothetical protein